jgi:hypothetical protein
VLVRKTKQVTFVFAQNLYGKWVTENRAMVEQLMGRALAGDHESHAAGFVGLHIGPLLFFDRFRIVAQFLGVSKGASLMGTSWRIYGNWIDDVSKLEMRIDYLLV